MYSDLKWVIKQLSYQPEWSPQQKWQILLTLFPEKEELEEYKNKFNPVSQEMIAKFKSKVEQKDLKPIEAAEKIHHIQKLTICDENYPKRLKELYDPPLTLFYQGNIHLLKKKCPLGIVGSRRHSEIGPVMMKRVLAPLLAHKIHFSIISGLALGIDGLAHQWAIENKVATVAVVGNGLDIPYPKTNQAMQSQIVKNHLILSEYPVSTRPLKHHFPQRNRIVAGLSRGIYVVEARKRSGSLITAYRAVDENRDVFVTPASILDEHFTGSNRLLQLGASPLLSGHEILEEWQLI